jgi:SulP family sulfate permease
MGIVMAFISHSAVKGFTAAAAIIITVTQLPYLLGINVARHEYIISMLIEIVKELPDLQWATTLLGLTAFGIIYGLKKIRPNFPAALWALITSTLAVGLLNLNDNGVAIVGQTPKGLPTFQIPFFDFCILSSLAGPAVVIALVSFAETYSVGKAISAETKQKVDVNQEVIGQGMANLIGSFFQSYPVSGSFSRTAINFASGARFDHDGKGVIPAIETKTISAAIIASDAKNLSFFLIKTMAALISAGITEKTPNANPKPASPSPVFKCKRYQNL